MTARQYLDKLVDLSAIVAGAYSREGERAKVQAVADRLTTLRSEPAAHRAAAEILFRADVSDATALLDAGDFEGGGARLLALRDAAPTSALRAQVETLLAGMHGPVTRDLPASLYRKATSRLSFGDYAGATDMFQQVIDQSPDPELVRLAREGLQKVAQARETANQIEYRVERYNGAAEFYAAGDLRAAAVLLRRLIEEKKDDFIDAQARELLAKIEAAPGSPR
jgi:tetratricopeptide (TPR) repeat protein